MISGKTGYPREQYQYKLSKDGRYLLINKHRIPLKLFKTREDFNKIMLSAYSKKSKHSKEALIIVSSLIYICLMKKIVIKELFLDSYLFVNRNKFKLTLTPDGCLETKLTQILKKIL